jgi:hypothetical protein
MEPSSVLGFNKFCKSVLGIKKTSGNICAKSELGRLPLDTFIKTKVILYFSRINCKEINRLVQEAFKLNKKNQIIYMIDQQGHAGNLTCIF